MRARIITLLFLFLAAGIGAAADIDTIEVRDAWARATPPGLDVGAAYLVIRNRGGDDRLVRGTSPIAQKVEFHRTMVQDGVVRMREQPAVPVAAGDQLVFAPGGMHLMLLGLEQPLAAGERFPLTLTFERAGSVEVEVEVRRAGAHGQPAGHGPAHEHDHGHDHAHAHDQGPGHGHGSAQEHGHGHGAHDGH